MNILVPVARPRCLGLIISWGALCAALPLPSGAAFIVGMPVGLASFLTALAVYQRMTDRSHP